MMKEIRVNLKSDPSIKGVTTQRLANGWVIVFWDGESGGDYVLISDLEGVVEQEIMEIVPDHRTYEFRIVSIDEDLYYSQVRPTGKIRLVEVGRCDGCKQVFPKVQLMSSSSGTACPDCYDKMSS